MASIQLTGDELVVHLTTPEKVASLHRDVRLPARAIKAVAVEPQPLAAVRGLRAPGLSIPGRTKIGTWRRFRRRGFVVARRDMPAVRVRLAGGPYDDVLISTPDAEATAAAIQKRWEKG
jgi:hypothetical protein